MNQREIRIVVNADDLGASPTINDAIAAALAGGLITSATLMANGPAFGAGVDITRRFAQASFGVHLNLTEFAPLTRHPGLAPLLGPDGCFRREGAEQARWSPRFHDAVVAEWSAQVARILDAGVAVSHLDSHHHTHTVPAVFPALKAVQRRFGLRRVRTTWNIYDRAMAPPPSLLLKKRLWDRALRAAYRTRSTDGFAGFLMFLQAVGEGSYVPVAGAPTLELMVHPDTGDRGDPAEAVALRGGWLGSLGAPARLVSYRDI